MHLDLFNELILRNLYHVKSYRKHELIKRENTNHKKIYLIKEGIVSIHYQTENGDSMISLILNKNQTFGAEDLLGTSYCHYESRSAFSYTIIYIFDIAAVYGMIDYNKRLMKDFLSIIHNQLVDIESRIRILTLPSAEERLLATFTDMAKKSSFEPLNQMKCMFYLPLNHSELGDYIRSSRIRVCKILNSLKCKSIISQTKNFISFRKDVLCF